MKRFTVRVEGFQMPEGDEYTLLAENNREAKKKATERFKKDFPYNDYDYVEVTVIDSSRKIRRRK